MVRPGYKQTEVGEIPEDWTIAPISELGKVIRGASPRPKGDPRFYGGPIPRLMVEDVTRDGKYVTPIVDSLTEDGAALSRPCKAGTLTFVCSGDVGVPAFLAVDACIHDGFLALIAISDAVSDDYLFHYVGTQRERLDHAGTHGGVFKNLTTQVLKDFSVSLPPIAEQKAIAEALSDVDALIAELEALIEKKRAVKTATMQQLLTGKTRLPGFNGEWKLQRLEEIGSFSKGKGIKKDEVMASGVPAIRYGEIYTKYHFQTRNIETFISNATAASAHPLRKGDIVFAASGETLEEIGKCAVYLGDVVAFAGGDTIVFSPNKDHPVFLSYTLNSFTAIEQKKRMGQGDAVVHIHASNLKNLKLKLPNFDEQTEIAETLSGMDDEIELIETRLAKTKAIKQGMMQELLTGRTRLV